VPLQLDTPRDELLEGDPDDVGGGGVDQRAAAVAAVDGRVHSERQACAQGVRVLLYLNSAHNTLRDAAGIAAHRVADDPDLVENVRQLRGRCYLQRRDLCESSWILHGQQSQIGFVTHCQDPGLELLAAEAVSAALNLKEA